MANRLLGTLRTTRLGSHFLTPVLLAAIAFALIGLALPPLSSDAGAGAPLDGGRATGPLAPPEDLAPFRTMSRWGTDIQSLEDAPADERPVPTGLNPELVKLGFIAVSLSAAEQAVLLTHPDGHAIRLVGGDSLPDGRTLVSVTANALTLEDATGQRETLVLFPRLSADGADQEPNADQETQ